MYGNLPSAKELARWDEALMRHSAVPVAVERAVAALPHDAHFMGIVLTAHQRAEHGAPGAEPGAGGAGRVRQPRDPGQADRAHHRCARLAFSFSHIAQWLVQHAACGSWGVGSWRH